MRGLRFLATPQGAPIGTDVESHVVETDEKCLRGTVRHQVAVIGAGYVGVPTALVLATFGHQVTVAERDDNRRSEFAGGRSPLLEEGLEDVLRRALSSGNISFCSSAADAARDAKFVFLCVATPTGPDGRADVTDIDAAVRQIAPVLRDDAIVINKSTVPLGTAESVRVALGRPEVAVVSNPEFLREGKAVYDSFHPHRIVVGSNDEVASRLVAELFAPTGAPVIVTDASTAELTKYVANAYLALKLSFINSVAELCDATDADISDLVIALGLDPRIGQTYLTPGPGWGGSCLPKDVSEFMGLTRSIGITMPLIDASHETNLRHQIYVVDRVLRMCGREPHELRVAGLGLTFKANTNDRRDSPAISVLQHFAKRGVRVVAYDPTVPKGTRGTDIGDFEIVNSSLDAARGADAIVVLTEWPEYSEIDWHAIGRVVRTRFLLDTRSIVDSAAARNAKFEVHRMGRPTLR
jgi:UDPglucose 6-dehydrogenase